MIIKAREDEHHDNHSGENESSEYEDDEAKKKKKKRDTKETTVKSSANDKINKKSSFKWSDIFGLDRKKKSSKLKRITLENSE